MKNSICHWIARHLPKRLVYWCYIVVGAYATTGKYSNTLTTDLTMMDAMKRYGDDHLSD